MIGRREEKESIEGNLKGYALYRKRFTTTLWSEHKTSGNHVRRAASRADTPIASETPARVSACGESGVKKDKCYYCQGEAAVALCQWSSAGQKLWWSPTGFEGVCTDALSSWGIPFRALWRPHDSGSEPEALPAIYEYQTLSTGNLLNNRVNCGVPTS